MLNEGVSEFVNELKEADALVIGAPLYVDGLPAQAVKLLEMLQEDQHITHEFGPVYDEKSKILILGSLESNIEIIYKLKKR